MQIFRHIISIIIFTTFACLNDNNLKSLYIAVRSNNVEKARMLSQKVDVNKIADTSNLENKNIRLYENKNPVLIEAVILNQPEMVKMLLENGADVNIQNKTGATALMLAAQNNSVDILNILLQSGADIFKKDSEGFTAFMYTAFKGHAQCMDILINNGSDINEKDNNGNTVLIWSVRYGNTDIVRMLVSKNADKKIKNNQNMSAMDFAEKLNHQKIKMILNE